MVSPEVLQTNITASRKRRLRRKRLHAARTEQNIVNNAQDLVLNSFKKELNCIKQNTVRKLLSIEKGTDTDINRLIQNLAKNKPEMSSNESTKTRDDVVAAREAKKLAKQKGKSQGSLAQDKVTESTQKDINQEQTNKDNPKTEVKPVKSKDEVDRAIIKDEPKFGSVVKSKEEIKAERTAKKATKQSKKKKDDENDDSHPNSDMTMEDVVETLKDIVNVAKEVQDVTAKVQAINLEPKRKGDSAKMKPQAEDGKNDTDTEGSGKSKAELKAERRAKQEAQRAAKQAATQQKVVVAAPVVIAKAKIENTLKSKEERPPKSKSVEKSKPKTQSVNRVNWFQHLHKQQDKEDLKKIPINSNLHPAIIKLGVQLASRVVTGSNARCIALLDALKKMVKDYTLPAKTEFARGLEAHLAAHLEFLWAMRQPSASQTNAVKFFRHHLTQLPNNVDEFDAKKTLQEEIDRYIREQIDMAGEAISLAVRNKICDGDNILTYGCSSLIERILVEAWEAGVRFRAVVVGARVGGSGAREMLRRLVARSLPAQYIDITALSYVMPTMNKVILGASSLLVNGSVLGAAGTAQTALAARARNVPVLVACETHKVSERVQTDAFVYNEIGDPDELVDNDDDRTGESPLKDWRSNPNLTPLNLTYDVTPPSLVSAVVTELAILPCTSAPVVLRFKLSEYGIQG